MNGSPIKAEVAARHVLEGTIRECLTIVGEPGRRRWATAQCVAIRQIDMECMFRAAVHGQQSLDQILHVKVLTERGEPKPYCTIRLPVWQEYWSKVEPTMRRTAQIPRLWEYCMHRPGAMFPFAGRNAAEHMLRHSAAAARPPLRMDGIALIRFSSRSGHLVIQRFQSTDSINPLLLELSEDGKVEVEGRWVELHSYLESRSEFTHLQLRKDDGSLDGHERFTNLTAYLREGK